VMRIVMLSRLTGATPWPWVPASLLASGVYQEVLQSAGIALTLPGPSEIHGPGPGHRYLTGDRSARAD
jgi:hypothetical protein